MLEGVAHRSVEAWHRPMTRHTFDGARCGARLCHPDPTLYADDDKTEYPPATSPDAKKPKGTDARRLPAYAGAIYFTGTVDVRVLCGPETRLANAHT